MGSYVRLNGRFFGSAIWNEARDYSRPEAFLELVHEAARCTSRGSSQQEVNGNPVEVGRGQVAVSVRDVGIRWGWARSKVSRFLLELEEQGFARRVRTETGRSGYTVIEVARFEEFLEEKDREVTGPDSEIVRLWDIWVEKLGGKNGKKLKPTKKRKTTLKLLWKEQLEGDKDPFRLFEKICEAVSESDHHMANPSYLVPESLFRNEERRSRWVMAAQSGSKKAGSFSLGGEPTKPEIRDRDGAAVEADEEIINLKEKFKALPKKEKDDVAASAKVLAMMTGPDPNEEQKWACIVQVMKERGGG